MKKVSILLFFIFLVGITNFTYADYPIVGYRYIADPGFVVFDGRLYLFCSNDDDNEPAGTNYDMHSIVCISTTDMKNWTDHGIVFNVPKDASWANLSWAPSVVYRNNKFYMYYGNGGGGGIGVAVSNSPTGPYKDALGKALITSSTPGVQPATNLWLFDPMTFVDDDGQAYMYFGGNGDDNMRVIKLNADMISINGSATKFTVPNFFEASWMHKRNGKYYFSYCARPGVGTTIDYMMSDKPTTGFTYGGVVSGQPPSNNYDNNHQGLFEYKGEWYQAYHNRIVAINAGVATGFRRNMAIDKFTYATDGKINKMTHTANGLVQLEYLNPYVRVEAETTSDHKGIETDVCSAGGMNVTSIDNGDWVMIEGVDFGTIGANSFSANVASTKTGGTIEIRLGSATGTLAGTIQVPNTGGVQTWKTETISITNITGVKNVYLVFKGSTASLFNVDYWKFASSGPSITITAPLANDTFVAPATVSLAATATTASGTISKVEFYNGALKLGEDITSPYTYSWTNVAANTYPITAIATNSAGQTATSTPVIVKINIPQSPYGGTPHPIPGKIELEHFDLGGNGFAYFDNTPGSAVTPIVNFRTDEDIDIENCTDIGGGYNLGWTAAGEWLEYTVNVATAGKYIAAFRVACSGTDRTISLSSNGTAIATDIVIPNTTGWQVWQDVTKEVTLAAGIQVLRLTIGTVNYVNLNYMSFTPIGTPPPTVTSPIKYCQGASATVLTATGTALKWYTSATGGTALASAPVPSTTTVGSSTYYVTQTLNGIESERIAIAVTILTTPAAPIVISPVIYNVNAIAVPLTATGTNVKWYTTATGGIGVITAPTPSTAVVGTTAYYVSQTESACESNRATISVEVVIPDNQKIALKTGWNLIGFPFNTNQDVATALSSIINEVEIIKDNDGFWKTGQNVAFNSLNTLNWGKGYLVKVSADCVLIWKP